MERKLDRQTCTQLLKDKAAQLGRYPRRTDFAPDQVAAIKAFLGPWPRALEAADIKPPRSDGFEEKKTERRIRAKRRKTQAKKERKENK